MSPRLTPPMSRRPQVYVHLLPALIPEGALRGGVAVVIDVLRATTTMIHALAAGCDAIMPCNEIEEARRIARSLPEGSALLAGERQGLPIDGFDLGNSPGDCTPDVCSGKTLVMTTTNGTRAILASLDAERVLVAAFVNRKATVEALKVEDRPIHLVCAGTDGQISLEDSMFAGALALELDEWVWEESAGTVASIKIDEPETTPETILANDEARDRRIALARDRVDHGRRLCSGRCLERWPRWASGPLDRPRSRPRGRRPARPLPGHRRTASRPLANRAVQPRDRSSAPALRCLLRSTCFYDSGRFSRRVGREKRGPPAFPIRGGPRFPRPTLRRT